MLGKYGYLPVPHTALLDDPLDLIGQVDELRRGKSLVREPLSGDQIGRCQDRHAFPLGD
jgi:hypothetical protein